MKTADLYQAPPLVLVVDDSKSMRFILRQEMEEEGYQVAEASEGEQALAAYARLRPDIVLLDAVMPVMDGFTCCAQLQTLSSCDSPKGDSYASRTPVLMITALEDQESVERAFLAGATDYITKPIHWAVLRQRVRRLIQQSHLYRQLEKSNQEFQSGIRQLRCAEVALLESEERYALAARGANDGLWDWNLKTDKIYFSTRWKSMLGCKENDIGNSLEEWFHRIHPDDIERVKAALIAHFKGLTPHFENEHRMLYKNGQYRWMLSRGLAVRNPNGEPYRIAGSQTDITDRKRTETQLLHNAFHDALTGLPNRAFFMERLSHAISRAKESKDYLFAVLFLDLDRFKVINDSLGHLIGDQLLIAIARTLEECVRPGDMVARLGGDEFTIVLENIQNVEDATLVADRIQKELSLPFNLSGHEVFTGVSIGIALSTTGYDQASDLLRDADTTMYRAKAKGKARSEVFDTTMHTQAMALLQLETDLQRALKRQEFRLYYQPIVSLLSGRITGFEALIRWQHPNRGLIYPAEFIPVAEETGLIVPITWWVLGEACRQMRHWQVQFPAKAPLTISVNLSGKQFVQPNLIEQIEQILHQTGLDARSLALEITESTIMQNAEGAVIILKQLRSNGVKLFLDDFGTGYSSLNYLHRFPFNTLKIDRDFVSRMGVDGENSAIVRTIATLAHSLEMNVTAEGVETVAQMAQLCGIKCEQGQGYFFSKPVDAEAAGALIKAELHGEGTLLVYPERGMKLLSA